MASQEMFLKQFQTIVDEVSTANITYIGKAEVGTKTDVAKWQIFVVDKTVTGITTIKYACQPTSLTPTKEPQFKWTDRTTITYALSV